MPFKQMENLAKANLKGSEAVVLVSKEGGVCVVSKGKISAVDLAKKISKKLGADAGGTKRVARGGARNTKGAGKVLKAICG
jgi:alanyl-tRNA synthetase